MQSDAEILLLGKTASVRKATTQPIRIRIGELMTDMQKRPTKIRVIYGESRDKEALTEKVQARYKKHNRQTAFVNTSGVRDVTEAGGFNGH